MIQLTKEFSAICIGYLDVKLFRILLCWQGGQGPDKNCKWWPCLEQCKGEEREKRPTWVQRTQLLWPVFLKRIFFFRQNWNVIGGQFLFMDPRIWYSFVSDAVHFFKYWKRISLNIERELVLERDVAHCTMVLKSKLIRQVEEILNKGWKWRFFPFVIVEQGATSCDTFWSNNNSSRLTFQHNFQTKQAHKLQDAQKLNTWKDYKRARWHNKMRSDFLDVLMCSGWIQRLIWCLDASDWNDSGEKIYIYSIISKNRK